MKNNPYVGPRPYERGDRHNFYGREREARDLVSLILAERVVLFYAPSGAGKTSLLNAQIIPAVEEEGFQVLSSVRVGSDLPPDVDPKDVENVFVFSALMSLAGEDVPANDLIDHTLLSFLHQQGLSQDRGLERQEAKAAMWELDYCPPIFIVDQFEELFATHRDRWQDARGFFEQVRDALHGLPMLGVVFTMREDHVAELDPYVHHVPGRMRTRFRMERLDREGALAAVRKPAEHAGCPFDPGVVARLVDDLRRIKHVSETGGQRGEALVLGPYVEPVQLQVVCSRLWENLPEQKDNTIQWEEIEAFGDVDRALTDFYEDAVARCVHGTGVGERLLRRWFSEQLITPMATRGLVLRGETETAGLPNQAVDILEDQHLIRADRRAGARWYELSHDRLVDPVWQANQAWEAARETPLRATARRWQETNDESLLYRSKVLREALAWAETHPSAVEAFELDFLEVSQSAERDRARRQRLYVVGAVASVVVLIIMAALALWALYERGRSVAQRRIAEQQARLARSRELAAASVNSLTTDPERSVLLASRAISITYAEEGTVLPEAVDALQRAVQTSRTRLTLTGHRDRVVDIAYSPDGRHLVTVSWDRSVRVWDVSTGEEVLKLSHNNVVNTVAYSPDGRWLATAGLYQARLWDLNAPEPAAGPVELHREEDWVMDAAFSPDGRYLATASVDGIATVWDVSTQEQLLTLPHEEIVDCVAFSPDGRWLATGSGDEASLWDLDASEAAAKPMVLRGHEDKIMDVAFSPDGRSLATGSIDGTAKIWDISSVSAGGLEESVVAVAGEEPLTLSGHTNTVFGVAFDSTGRRLATASGDGTAKVWNIAPDASDKRELLTLAGHTESVSGIAFSPNNARLATASWDSTVKVWDGTIGHTDSVLSVEFGPDGARLATAGEDGKAIVWDAVTRRIALALSDHSDAVTDIAFGPDGKRLVTSSRDGTVKITAASGEPLLSIDSDIDLGCVDFSPDGTRVAAADEVGNTAYVWNAASGERLLTLTDHTSWIDEIAFSPDGTHLATTSQDCTAKIWDAETGAVLSTLSHNEMVFGIAFNADGTRLATTTMDGEFTVWEAATGQQLFTCPGHSNVVTAIAFSPDGTRLATASYDKMVKVWNADACGEALQTFAHGVGVNDVAFSPDGGSLATAGADNELRIYVLDVEALIALARARVTRSLTTMECREFLHTECPRAAAGGAEYELPYSDEFASVTSGWTIRQEEWGRLAYDGGQYHIIVKGDSLVWGNPSKSFADFTLEVEAAQVGGPDDNEYGVLLRYIDRNNFYSFGISGDGFYQFSKRENGVWSTLLEWTECGDIRKGNATNTIRVACQGDRFTFYVNGVELTSYTDSTFAAGDIGLYATTYEEGSTHVSFDHLSVEAIE
jgi:WD40 repeat protein